MPKNSQKSSELSETELSVLRKIGKSNKQIGHELHFTQRSVGNIFTRIFRKVGLEEGGGDKRIKLLRIALQNGLIKLDELEGVR